MKFSLSLSGLLLMSTAIAHDENKSNFTDKEIEKIEYAKEMTKELTDFHTLIDQDLDKSVMVNTAAKLHEKPNDKDLAPIVFIVNRASKGTASDAQRAKYCVNGRLEATYIVSTGKIGHESRTGYFRSVYTNYLRFYHEYYSGKYDSRMAV